MREIYRHASNTGSVIVFNRFGTEVSLYVPDAQFRYRNSCIRPYAGGQSGSTKKCNVNFGCDHGTIMHYANEHRYPLDIIVSDNELQDMFPYLELDLTAKQNTEFITKQYPVSLAIIQTQAIDTSTLNIPNELEIPNLYDLMVLFCESDRIDMLDPTAPKNRYLNLGYRNPYGRFGLNKSGKLLSSTFLGKDSFATLTYSSFWGTTKSNKEAALVPVKEL